MYHAKSKILALVFCQLLFCLSAADVPAAPLIGSISPSIGEMGLETEITILGSGFNGNTRVAMIPNSSGREKIIGELAQQHMVDSLAVTCNTAYFAGWDGQGTNGLFIIDISDATEPSLMGLFETRAEYVAVAGTKAYVVGFDVLKIIDVSDPATPQLIDSATFQGYSYFSSITVVDDTAYLLGSDLLIVDVNPASPSYLTVLGSSPHGGMDFTVKNGIAYVATDGDSSLQLIDVSNPALPSPLGSVPTPRYTSDVDVEGNIAYVTHMSGIVPGAMLVVDVSDPVHPTTLGSYQLPGDPVGVVARNKIAYVESLQTGVHVIDASDPANPSLISFIKTNDRGISLIEGTPYIAVSGLQIMDVSNISYPTVIGSMKTPGNAEIVTVHNEIAYVVDNVYGSGPPTLHLVDVSNIAEPSIISSILPEYQIADIKVTGTRVYFTEFITGSSTHLGKLTIYDISDPETPVFLGSRSLHEYFKFDVAGSTAYVLDRWGDLELIDVGDPANPTHVYTLDLPGTVHWASRGDVRVRENLAYVASTGGYFHVIDVSNSTSPTIISSLPRVYDSAHLTVVGNRVYIGSGRLDIIDISAPETPTLLGEYAASDGMTDMAVIGTTVYVASEETGVGVFDASVPASVKFIGQVETAGDSLGLFIENNIAYVADGGLFGLTIVPVPSESPSVTFVSGSEITAAIPAPPAAGNYTIRVFDETGAAQKTGAITYMDQPPRAKALIVPGYGPHSTNKVWEETLLNANHAYQVLVNQGYAKEDIRYLSAVSVDVDNDNISDVYADATLANLEQSITSWGADADDLILYLVGHGNTQTFVVKHTDLVTEVLHAGHLADVLNSLQNGTSKRTIFLYDACYSGSFVDPVKIPEGQTYDRVLMTSTTANKVAILGNNGRTSFSYQFWENVLAGKDLTESFGQAADFMMQYNQTALLDGNCDGVPNTPSDSSAEITIGRGYNFGATSKPYITCYSQDTTFADSETVDFWVKAISTHPITRVWAEIIPPNYNPLAPNAPELATFDLIFSTTARRYEGSFNGFIKSGTYLVSFYAANDQQEVSLPSVNKITVPSFPWNLFLPSITGNDN